MKISSKIKVTVTTGLALFAMFFGAGNMIFPLKVGTISGQHVFAALGAFLIAGVGVPFLGVFATSLYEGNYWKFFGRIGKIPAFLVITFLMFFIGPLFAGPRTEVITFHTLMPMLPSVFQNPYLFDAVYFALIFALVFEQSHVVDIIGGLFSPIKIITFTILILIGAHSALPLVPVNITTNEAFKTSITMGYGTMDLLAAFFFCSVAYKNVVNKCHQIGFTSERAISRMMLMACLIGALLISVTYTGLIYVAATHADALQNTPTEGMIAKISDVILGGYGSLFVAVCVTVACLATAATLVEVTSDYLHHMVFRKKVSRLICMIIIVGTMYMMAILGFEGIMKIAGPILEVMYPALIVLCVVNMASRLIPEKYRYSLMPLRVKTLTETE